MLRAEMPVVQCYSGPERLPAECFHRVRVFSAAELNLVRDKDVMNLAPEMHLFLAAFPVSSLQPHLQQRVGFSPALFSGAR